MHAITVTPRVREMLDELAGIHDYTTAPEVIRWLAEGQLAKDKDGRRLDSDTAQPA